MVSWLFFALPCLASLNGFLGSLLQSQQKQSTTYTTTNFITNYYYYYTPHTTYYILCGTYYILHTPSISLELNYRHGSAFLVIVIIVLAATIANMITVIVLIIIMITSSSSSLRLWVAAPVGRQRCWGRHSEARGVQCIR